MLGTPQATKREPQLIKRQKLSPPNTSAAALPREPQAAREPLLSVSTRSAVLNAKRHNALTAAVRRQAGAAAAAAAAAAAGAAADAAAAAEAAHADDDSDDETDGGDSDWPFGGYDNEWQEVPLSPSLLSDGDEDEHAEPSSGGGSGSGSSDGVECTAAKSLDDVLREREEAARAAGAIIDVDQQ
jgi:hypothetical protein